MRNKNIYYKKLNYNLFNQIKIKSNLILVIKLKNIKLKKQPAIFHLRLKLAFNSFH